MNSTDSQRRQFGKAALLIVPACAMTPQIAAAQSEPRAVLDVSVGGTADSNPFLQANGEAAGSVVLKVDPKVFWEDESTNVTLDGGLRYLNIRIAMAATQGFGLGRKAQRKSMSELHLPWPRDFNHPDRRFRTRFLVTI